MVLFFSELLVRGTALCLLIALALLVMRRTAATYRHLLCTLALGGLLTLPLVQELLPPLPLLEAPKPVAIAAPVAPVVLAEPIPSEPIPSEPIPPAPFLGTGKGKAGEGVLGQVGGLRAKHEQRAGWVLACWTLGATLLLLRLAVALVRLRGLVKGSQCTTLLGTEILRSEQVTTPLTWGVRRPVILLPAALLTGEPAVAESALRHEKAHIARRDWLWHLLAEVVCALCWFQPGAWWLRRRLRAESERACDDRVLLSGVSGPDYAAHLLEILKVGRASTFAPGMAEAGSMEARVKHILDPQKPRRSHGLRLALTAALGLVLLPLASLKVAAKPGDREPPVNRLQAAAEVLAPKLAFLTPSALLAQAKATLSAPKPIAVSSLAAPSIVLPANPLMPQIIPLTAPSRSSDAGLQNVFWGEAVDGLKAGLLSNSSVPLGSHVSYQVFVQNTTDKPLDFIVQCLPYNGQDVPWLLPKANITEELTSGKVPPELRAQGSPHIFDGEDPAHVITLAPGEVVLLPGTYSLFVGNGNSDGSPSVAMAQAGKNWLVQPLTFKRISPSERAGFGRLLGEFKLTKIDHTGKSRTENAIRIPAIRAGKTLYAMRQLDVLSPSVPKNPNGMISLKNVTWGEAVDGLEPGFLLTGVTLIEDELGTTKIGYTALVRNKTKQPITFLVRLLQYDGYDVPFTQNNTPESKFPPTEPAKGVRHTDLGRDAVNLITLAPGESVLVPGQEAHHNLQVLIGSGDGGKSPYFEKIKPGMDMLVQPLTVYRTADTTRLTRDLARYSVTKLAPDGTTRTESSVRVSMPDSGGTTLEAQLWFSKIRGTSAAPATSITTEEPGGPMIPLDSVVWSEPVDGLAAGFLVTTPGHPNHYRVPMNSKLNYQTLVRNTSNKPISFLTRLLPYDGYEVPSVGGKPTKGAKRTYPLDPLYEVTLAPGESVLVPGNTGVNLAIYVGDGDSDGSPSIAQITPGHLKIVQPITIYRSPDHSKLPLLEGIDFLTKVSPDGRPRSELATRASGGKGRIEGGQTLEAHIFLEVGTLNAAAPRNAASAVWGTVENGVQCGLRMLTNQRVFKTGDTLEAELLWRNAGDKTAHWVLPRQLDIVSIIREASGRGRGIDTGGRFDLVPFSTDYAPGEVRSLGILKVTLVPEGTPSPKSNKEPGHITLAPGAYFFSGSGGVSREGDPCPHSGEVAFTVADNEPAKSDIELSLRLPKGVTTFTKLSQAHFEVVVRNRSDKPLTASWMNPANFGFYCPDLFTKDGEPIPYVHTVGGPYTRQGRQLASGETVVLGTIALPREVREHWDSLPPGPYLASGSPPPSPYEARFSLGITVSGKSEQKLSARLPFVVTRPR